MLPHLRNLRIILHRIQRISILHRKPVSMVHKMLAIRNIMHKQRPKLRSHDRRLCIFLLLLNPAKEFLQRTGSFNIARPVILARHVSPVCGANELDALLELGGVGRVEVVREDVDFGDVEVALVDAVGSVHDEFLWCK